MNVHYHKQTRMRDRLRDKVKGALEVTIDPDGLHGIYRLFREYGIVDSKLDFARQCGVNRETIRRLLSKKHDVSASLESIRRISDFVLPHLEWIYPNYSTEELARTLLAKGDSKRKQARLEHEVVKSLDKRRTERRF